MPLTANENKKTKVIMLSFAQLLANEMMKCAQGQELGKKGTWLPSRCLSLTGSAPQT